MKDTQFKIDAVVTSVTKYVGHNGVLFDTADDARASLAMPLLEDILEAGGDHYDFSIERAAKALIARRAEVIRLLQRMDPPRESAPIRTPMGDPVEYI